MIYLIFDSLEEAQAMNDKIQQYMIETVKRYNATQWSKICKNNDETKFAIFIKENDPRNPQNALDDIEKSKLIELDDTWFSDGLDSKETLHYVEN